MLAAKNATLAAEPAMLAAKSGSLAAELTMLAAKNGSLAAEATMLVEKWIFSVEVDYVGGGKWICSGGKNSQSNG
ncbi:hypothetical protein [Lysinibacillus xylanilyticus]|uniref:hypothetical protein n=1 Tax=Lysinibacillus xylanilyticus TaxID=582475 RepID=UPI00083CA3AD|nr:hypothetical protein [Lysinibacillus xylanilyticus]